MKLQQLRYIVEIVNYNLNVSTTAEALYTSQPGISKQVRLLEDELGLEIFFRNGKHLSGVTPAGQKIINVARDILAKVETVQVIAREHIAPDEGLFCIAATHLPSRELLPALLQEFMPRYPKVKFRIHQSTPEEAINSIRTKEVDLIFTYGCSTYYQDVVLLPCYRWCYSVITLPEHPLAGKSNPIIKDLLEYPLIIHEAFFHQYQALIDTLLDNGHNSKHPIITVRDMTTIEAYVKAGVGVGIGIYTVSHTITVSELTVKKLESGNVTGTLFLGINSTVLLRNYIYDFISHISPDFTVDFLEQLKEKSLIEVKNLLGNIKLPNLIKKMPA